MIKIVSLSVIAVYWQQDWIMSKKSRIDERLDTLFAGFDPEENVSKVERISEVDQDAAHWTNPVSARQNSKQIVPSKPGHKNLIILISAITICLLTAIFIFPRFQAALASPPPKQFIATLAGSTPDILDTPSIQDTQPPSVPSGLTATVTSSTTVNLAWTVSTDNIGVSGYTIYRNGVSFATTSSSNLVFSDTTAMPDISYSYALDAYDQAGNHSAVSAPLQVTTPAEPGSLIFLLPVADTYVNADSPTFIYGAASTLRVDASPDVHAYLRYNVYGLNGKTINRARLMLYTKSGVPRDIQVVAVADGNWDELTTNYNNAPTLGGQLALSPAAEAATWITLDVTPYIAGEGTFNFGVVADGKTAISLASREAGANAPQLILDLR